MINELVSNDDTSELIKNNSALTRSLLNAHGDLAILINKSGDVLEINNAALKSINKKREEVVGNKIFNCISHEINKERKDILEFVFNTKSPSYFIDKIGDHWFENKYHPILENGEINLVAIFSKDITQEKNTQKELVYSEEKLRLLFERAPDAYYLMDKNGVFTDLNRATEELFGYSREELIGKHFFDFSFVVESQKDIIKTLVKKIEAGESTGPKELISNHKDGTRLLVESRTIPLEINDNQKVLGIARDLSSMKKMEDALLESELNYIQMFEHALEAIMLIDVNTLNIVRVNNSAAEQLGYTKGQLLRKKLLDIIPKDDSHETLVNIGVVAEKGHGILKSRRLTKDGDIIPVEVSVKVSKFLGRDVYQSFSRDISDRIKLERELTAHNKELVANVNDRKDQLKAKNKELIEALEKLTQAQSKLIHAEKMSSLGQLSAGIAHEINNPMNYIKQNVYSIKQGLLDYGSLFDGIEKMIAGLGKDHPINKEYKNLKEEIEFDYLKEEMSKSIEDIQEGVDQAVDITDELKQFSRNDEDSEIRLENINLVIDSTLKLMKSEFDKTRITINKSFIKGYILYCNVNKLNQVLMNILNNAIYAINKISDHGLIHVCTSISEDRELVILIKDNGCGMPQEVADKIFDPFYTTKKIGEGTGLGLSISHSIVESIGGRITVVSKENAGTTFNISLPIQKILEL